MKIWHTPDSIPENFPGAVVTIGVYDGVHRGHRAVLSRLVATGKEMGLPSLVLTFDPHPDTVHRPENSTELVDTIDDRLHRIEAAGVDITYVQHYSLDYAKASPEEFIRDQLALQLRAKCIVVGEDARFGAGNEGDIRTLMQYAPKYGYTVDIVHDQLDDSGKRLSSTGVREALATGDVFEARNILGRPHRITGIVQGGQQRGRMLGFPTANLHATHVGEVPADGVYCGWMVLPVPGAQATEYLPAAISVGTNPQFNGQERTVEVHALGRSDLKLYGREISVDFVSRIRPMMTFDSVEQLIERIDKDLLITADCLGVQPAGRIPPGVVTVLPDNPR